MPQTLQEYAELAEHCFWESERTLDREAAESMRALARRFNVCRNRTTNRNPRTSGLDLRAAKLASRHHNIATDRAVKSAARPHFPGWASRYRPQPGIPAHPLADWGLSYSSPLTSQVAVAEQSRPHYKGGKGPSVLHGGNQNQQVVELHGRQASARGIASAAESEHVSGNGNALDPAGRPPLETTHFQRDTSPEPVTARVTGVVVMALPSGAETDRLPPLAQPLTCCCVRGVHFFYPPPFGATSATREIIPMMFVRLRCPRRRRSRMSTRPSLRACLMAFFTFVLQVPALAAMAEKRSAQQPVVPALVADDVQDGPSRSS